MIKLCVFDMDGTILDSIEDLACAMNYALKVNNLPIHEELDKFKHFVGDGIYTFAYRAIPTPLNENENLRNKVISDYNPYYDKHYNVYSKPYDGIMELLNYLQVKKCHLAILTNKSTPFAKKIVDEMYKGIHFDYVIGPSEEFPKKPDTKALNMILTNLKVKPEECLYFGDTNTDMLTAINGKVIPIGVTWGFRDKQELVNSGAKYIINHPLEAIAIYEDYQKRP